MPSGLLIILCQLVPTALTATDPFLSSSASSGNSVFDQTSFTSNERSMLPGVQVFPQGQAFQGFLGRGGLGSGAVDLETWSKNQAVQRNQENAVVTQMAQMAPQRRNQLARDMANGNATAANELLTRLMRDLATSQHGMMAFPQLSTLAMDPQGISSSSSFGMSPLAMDPATLAAMRSAGFPASSSSSLFGLQGGALPLPLQLQLARQQQQRQQALLLNGGGRFPLGASSNGFQQPFNNPSSNFGQFGQLFGPSSSFSNADRFSSLQQIPRNPFILQSSSSSSSDLSDLSRPNPFAAPSSSSSSSFSSSSFPPAGQTQITPFSQSLFSSGRSSNSNNDFGRALSSAVGVGQSGAGAGGTVRTMDDLDQAVRGFSSVSTGKGFVDDVTDDDAEDDAFGGTTRKRNGGTPRKKHRMLLEAKVLKKMKRE